MRKPTLNNSNPGQSFYDPFCGSGTTVIAAEMEGRICYGMEIDPTYIDDIVKHWQNFAGKYVILTSNSGPFSQMKNPEDANA